MIQLIHDINRSYLQFDINCRIGDTIKLHFPIAAFRNISISSANVHFIAKFMISLANFVNRFVAD